MNDRIVDAVTRDVAAAVSRRTSLLGIGGAALSAAVAVPARSAAGKSGKRGKNRCKTQKRACVAYFAEHCATVDEPGACEDAWFPCCEPFARCNAGAGIACIVSAS